MNIYNWRKLSQIEREQLLQRPQLHNQQVILEKTKNLIEKVCNEGDQALLDLTAQLDGVQLTSFKVPVAEILLAEKELDDNTKATIVFAKAQIEQYHRAQLPKPLIVETQPGVWCERQYRPLANVGLYVPGGTAPLVSTVLMLGVPAQIVGCKKRILCTPPNAAGQIDPRILFAAKLCGIEHVYKVGGAQAIAAMAYGTTSIPKADKIFGPGNSWVTQAKLLIAQDPAGCLIDMPAGPTEVMIIADEIANPAFAAADLLSQAEHGTDSQVILLTASEDFAKLVQQEILKQLDQLPRYAIAKQALSAGRIFIVDDYQQAIEISNQYAPEHLILQLETYEDYVSEIENAGAVFLGCWSAEAIGDYVSGANHVLPTNGFARSYSGLTVNDYLKFIQFQTVTFPGLQTIAPYAEKMAQMEGLYGHQQAIAIRIKEA